MIKFGTDGFRGKIGDEFCFENIYKIAKAHAIYLKSKYKNPKVAISHDARFLSKEMANFVANIFQDESIKVVFSSMSPTPSLSCYVAYNEDIKGGVVITASHNPYIYNGYKIKDELGRASQDNLNIEIEKIANSISALHYHYKKYIKNFNGKKENFLTFHLETLKKFFNLDVFMERKIKIVHDPLFGATKGALQKFFKNTPLEIFEIHKEENPYFGNLSPEPIKEKNLKSLIYKVKSLNADVGIAHDGDGDRIGVVDENGNFITSQVMYALLLEHILKTRKPKGKYIIKTVSTGFLADKVAKVFNLEVVEVKVGFKNICKKIDELGKENVIYAGEESGGCAYIPYLMERDGIFLALLLIERIILEEKTLSQIVKEFFEKYSPSFYKRIDLPVEEKHKKLLEDMRKNPPEKFGNKKVKKVILEDGLKLIFENGSWLLLRPSGTEPLFRVYAESTSEKETLEILNLAKDIFS